MLAFKTFRLSNCTAQFQSMKTYTSYGYSAKLMYVGIQTLFGVFRRIVRVLTRGSIILVIQLLSYNVFGRVTAFHIWPSFNDQSHVTHKHASIVDCINVCCHNGQRSVVERNVNRSVMSRLASDRLQLVNCREGQWYWSVGLPLTHKRRRDHCVPPDSSEPRRDSELVSRRYNVRGFAHLSKPLNPKPSLGFFDIFGTHSDPTAVSTYRSNNEVLPWWITYPLQYFVWAWIWENAMQMAQRIKHYSNLRVTGYVSWQ